MEIGSNNFTLTQTVLNTGQALSFVQTDALMDIVQVQLLHLLAAAFQLRFQIHQQFKVEILQQLQFFSLTLVTQAELLM